MKVFVFPSTGFIHEEGSLLSVIITGTYMASFDKESATGPRSPASTRGPYITATLLLSSGIGSRRSENGIFTSTLSPLFQVLSTGTKQPGFALTFLGFPLTLISIPFLAQDG